MKSPGALDLETWPSGLWRTLGKRVSVNSYAGSNPVVSAYPSFDPSR